MHADFVDRSLDMPDRQGIVQILRGDRVSCEDSLFPQVKSLRYFFLWDNPFSGLWMQALFKNLETCVDVVGSARGSFLNGAIRVLGQLIALLINFMLPQDQL